MCERLASGTLVAQYAEASRADRIRDVYLARTNRGYRLGLNG